MQLAKSDFPEVEVLVAFNDRASAGAVVQFIRDMMEMGGNPVRDADQASTIGYLHDKVFAADWPIGSWSTLGFVIPPGNVRRNVMVPLFTALAASNEAVAGLMASDMVLDAAGYKTKVSTVCRVRKPPQVTEGAPSSHAQP
jgi:hypothetical protein